MNALAHQLMTQARRNASALASRVAKLHATLMAYATLCTAAGMSGKRTESRPVIGNGIVGFNWNTGSNIIRGCSPQVAGG